MFCFVLSTSIPKIMRTVLMVVFCLFFSLLLCFPVVCPRFHQCYKPDQAENTIHQFYPLQPVLFYLSLSFFHFFFYISATSSLSVKIFTTDSPHGIISHNVHYWFFFSFIIKSGLFAGSWLVFVLFSFPVCRVSQSISNENCPLMLIPNHELCFVYFDVFVCFYSKPVDVSHLFIKQLMKIESSFPWTTGCVLAYIWFMT